MNSDVDTSAQLSSPIPPDDPKRNLVLAQADEQSASHIGLVGDTYTILITGERHKRALLSDRYAYPTGRWATSAPA